MLSLGCGDRLVVMRPEDIKVGMEGLWSYMFHDNESVCCVFPLGKIVAIHEDEARPEYSRAIGELGSHYIRNLYPSKEKAQRALDQSDSEWRTDFENMPNDGTKFLAVTESGPEVVYRKAYLFYGDTLPDGVDEHQDGEPTENWWYRLEEEKIGSFWYSDEREAIDAEYGSIGDKRIKLKDFVCWMPIPDFSMFLDGDE